MSTTSVTMSTISIIHIPPNTTHNSISTPSGKSPQEQVVVLVAIAAALVAVTASAVFIYN